MKGAAADARPDAKPALATGPPVRIAHVQLLPILSGVQKVTLDELASLDRAAFEPFLICRSPGPLSETAEAHGIECLFADRLVRPISPRSDLAALAQLAGLMRRHRFDVVHTHSSKTGVLGRLAARLAGVPNVVHTVHGFSLPAANSKIEKALYFSAEWLSGRFSDAVVCLKEADAEFTRKWLRVPSRRVHLIPNGIDASRFAPLAADARAAVRRRVFQLAEGVPAVGMVGRLCRQKNPLCFVEAADLLLGEGIEAKFFLIGDGPWNDLVETEIDRRRRGGQIVVLGWRDDVPELLGALDLFVLTSGWEGLPLALLEALACGVPAVASDIPGNRDVVADGIDGLLATPADPESFAIQMAKLLADAELRAEFGRSGRQKVAGRYQLAGRVGRMADLYAALIEQNGRRKPLPESRVPSAGKASAVPGEPPARKPR